MDASNIAQVLSDRGKLYKILLYLWSHQTGEEQQAHSTVEDNGVGFNGLDANILSSFAEQISQGYDLSEKQMVIARLRLPKYHGQLANGVWMGIVLPEHKDRHPQTGERTILLTGGKAPGKSTQAKSEFTGTLDCDGEGLLFRPNIFPTKQIKEIGFTIFKEGAWHQARPHVDQATVDAVKKMFGKVFVTPKVEEALHPKPVELPGFIASNGTFFQFQKETVQFAITRKHSMIALAPGLGKTVCAILSAEAACRKRILIVSPLSLLYNWRNEIHKWLSPQEEVVIWYRSLLPIEARWTVTNYDTLRLHPERFENVQWDAIILDESILIKNRKALRTKAVKALVEKAKPECLWMLSGSPVSKLLDDMWAQLNILQPRRFSSYWRFAKEYCHVEQSQWGWNIVANRAGAEQQMVTDLADCYFSRTQDQVLDLPDWIFDEVHVPMSPEQDKLYAQMENTFVADLEDGDRVVAPIVLTQLLRLVQIASNPVLIGEKNKENFNGLSVSPKWAAAIDMLEYEKLPVIIWTSFKDTVWWLYEALQQKGYRVNFLTGDTDTETRQKIVDEFQTGKLDVIVAHPAVGKFGLTLTAARTAIYLERNHNGDDYYQSLHRVRRIGTKESPHVIHILSDRAEGGDTVDRVIDRVLSSRKDTSIALTTGELRQLFLEVK